MIKPALAFVAILFSANAFGATDLQKFVAQNCQDYKSKLLQTPRVTLGYEQVPFDWRQIDNKKIPLFWWKRQGSPQFPPLLLLHGGPGGNSTGYLLRMPKLIEQYPGDVFVIDERGEGCSNTLPANLPLSAYRHLSARNTVYDLEYLRKKFFKGKKWRALGQSRGSIVLHYYLDMFPESLESVHAHGWSVAPAHVAADMTRMRAVGYWKTAAAYAKKYPSDVNLIRTIRESISPGTCWDSYEDRRYCGPAVLDVFGFDLSRAALWEDTHRMLNSVVSRDGKVDPARVYRLIADRLRFDLFAHANYIVATLPMEVGYPSYNGLLKLKGTPELEEPILSEVRFLRNVILAAAPGQWPSGADPVDYHRIRRFLTSNPNFKYYLYAGALDPVAPPELFRTEVSILGDLVKFTLFPGSAHEGWWSEPLIQKRILEFR